MAVNSWILQRVMEISYRNSFLAVTFGFSVFTSIEALMLPLQIFIRGESLPVLNESNWLLRLPYFALKLMINMLAIFLIRRFNVGLRERGSTETTSGFVSLGSGLFTQTLLFIMMCYQYYSYQEHKRLVELSFVIGNTVLPIITLIIVAFYLWKYPKKT